MNLLENQPRPMKNPAGTSFVPSSLVPLVRTTRGYGDAQATENLHFGAVAVVDTKGQIRAYAGDPNFMTFSRSTIKPFQATPLVETGGVERFGLTPQELALICSSHNAETFHVDAALSILKKTDSQVSHLQCGCHEPYYYSTNKLPAPSGAVWNAIHNNCSGKHAGMLAWCQLHKESKDDYLELGHPLQQAIRKSLSAWTDVSTNQFLQGIDGCSAPNYGLPLKSLALAYARLADHNGSAAAKQLYAAMTEYPEYVSGTGRNDRAFMTAGKGDWVAKIGADGVQLIGIRSRGLGIAIKVADGNQRAVIMAAIETLRQLGELENIDTSPLMKWAKQDLTNVGGKVVGRVEACFELS